MLNIPDKCPFSLIRRANLTLNNKKKHYFYERDCAYSLLVETDNGTQRLPLVNIGGGYAGPGIQKLTHQSEKLFSYFPDSNENLIIISQLRKCLILVAKFIFKF